MSFCSLSDFLELAIHFSKGLDRPSRKGQDLLAARSCRALENGVMEVQFIFSIFFNFEVLNQKLKMLLPQNRVSVLPEGNVGIGLLPNI